MNDDTVRRGKRILIVEDDPHLHRLTAYHLSKNGFKVVSAYDGFDVMTRLSQESCDLAVVDVMLPGMDGFRVCEFIKDVLQIPVIIISAKTQPLDKIFGKACGADYYLTKPFRLVELTEVVKRLISVPGERDLAAVRGEDSGGGQ